MKKILFISVVLTAMAFGVQKKKRVIFFGDSITEAGVKPGGYIVHIDSMCMQENKRDRYEFIGAGIGGNKIYDLYLRLENDIIKKKPDVVVIFIGINDVWHKYLFGTGTDPDKFVKFYKAIIEKLKANKIKAVLCTPSAIGERTDYKNPYDPVLDAFCDSVRSVASAYKLPLIDLRKSFLEYNLINNPGNQDNGILTYPGDGVHLSSTGNLFVAEEMWKLLKTLN